MSSAAVVIGALWMKTITVTLFVVSLFRFFTVIKKPLARIILNQSHIKADWLLAYFLSHCLWHVPITLNTTNTLFQSMVGCFGFNGPLRQYFSLYRAVSQREGERGEKR